MKAAQINAYGGQEVLVTTGDAEKPKAGKGQVLIEVYAAGVNPFDWKVREGYMKEFIPLKLPATLGGDVAGIVAEIGESVSGFNIGDEVYGQANAAGGQGSYAEFTTVTSGQLAPKPKSVDFITAAAIPLAGTSALQAITEHINLQSGQKILIHGGAGGIGSYAVQIAKHLGAYVATTASAEDADFVKKLGVDEVIDYKSEDFTAKISGYDAAFDTVGGETYTKSYQVLKQGGVIVSMAEQPDDELTKKYGVEAVTQQSKVTPERLVKLVELVDKGIIKVKIGKVFPLEKAGEALEYLKQGRHQGKVVIKVRD